MATTQTPKHTFPVEDILQRAGAAQEQIAAAARSAAVRYLDTYEKAVANTIDLDLKLADSTRQDWVRDIVQTRAELTRDWTKASAGAARSLLS